MKELKQQPQTMDHIGIHQIIFDRSEWVTLWGFKVEKGKKVRMDYITDFDILNKLLRLSGEEGDRIQMLLVEELENGTGKPSAVNLDKVLGHPAFFNQCLLEVSSTWSKNEKGDLVRDKKCLSLDAVYPLLEKRQQTLSQHTRYRQTLLECEELLAKAYALYLGYQELDMDEETALKMADLEDDLKFKMAYFAWKMNHKAA